MSVAERPIRRRPPQRRRASVTQVAALSDHLVRVTLGGPELEGWPTGAPTGHCKLFLPSGDEPAPVLPEWGDDGPVFEPGRPRPVVRTYTPRRFDPEALELDLDMVLHGSGPASRWAATAVPGRQVAVAGVGRGYEIDPAARSFHLVGDESAIAAISVLLEQLPQQATVVVAFELRHAEAEVRLPEHPRALIRWLVRREDQAPGAALVEHVARARTPKGTRVWAATEAGAVRTIRRELLARGVAPEHLVTRGYWKQGESDHPDGDYAQDA